MAEVHTRTVSVYQQGTYYAVGSWVSPSTYTAWPGPPLFQSYQGQRFQLHTDMRVDKPRLQDLTLLLSVTQWPGPAAVLGHVNVALHSSGSTSDFSLTNPPSNPGPALLSTGWVTFGYDDGSGWSSTSPPAFIFIRLGTAVTDPVNGTTLYDLSGQWNVFEHCDANGYVNLSVLIYTNNGGVAVTPVLISQEIEFFTGLEGRSFEDGRPARDMKTGLPTVVPELVEDGYHPGVWTVPSQWDPADPRDERPVEFPSDEGQWEDDIPAR